MRIDPRFTLALVLTFLVGGALALWLMPQGQPAAPEPRIETSSAPVTVVEDGPGTFGLYTLALSWQPAFCETEPGKPECRNLTERRYDADHFALHGLWPEDNYCGVSGRLIDIDTNGSRRDLPDIGVSAATSDALDRTMPGTQSLLERHEWINHGTCSGVSAETYFSRAIELVDAVNASPLRELFARSRGQRLTRQAIADAFEAGFGEGLGNRVRVDCADDDGRELIVEVRIRLYGDVMGSAGIGQLLRAATRGASGCPGGIVDRAGDQ